MLQLFDYNNQKEGSGCGSVGRAVASDTRGTRFESCHWQYLCWAFIYLFTINCIEKTKKRGQEWPTFKNNQKDIEEMYFVQLKQKSEKKQKLGQSFDKIFVNLEKLTQFSFWEKIC